MISITIICLSFPKSPANHKQQLLHLAPFSVKSAKKKIIIQVAQHKDSA